MTAKEYLNQAYFIDKQINSKVKKAEMLRASLYGKGVNYENNGGSSPNSSGDALGRAVAKVVDYESEANEMINQLVELRLEIETVISELTDESERTVLEKRYLFFESWEQIAIDMGYSLRMIYYLNKKALKKIHVPDNRVLQ